MLNWLTPASHSERPRSGDSMPPCVISVMYLRRIASRTDATRSSRSFRSNGSPPVNVTSIGLKNRAASAQRSVSVSRSDDGVFQ